MVISRLVKIMENSSDRWAGLAAAKIIVDRGLGKVGYGDAEPHIPLRPEIPNRRITLKEIFEKYGIDDEPTDPPES